MTVGPTLLTADTLEALLDPAGTGIAGLDGVTVHGIVVTSAGIETPDSAAARSIVSDITVHESVAAGYTRLTGTLTVSRSDGLDANVVDLTVTVDSDLSAETDQGGIWWAFGTSGSSRLLGFNEDDTGSGQPDYAPTYDDFYAQFSIAPFSSYTVAGLGFVDGDISADDLADRLDIARGDPRTLAALGDVDLTTVAPTDGQALTYDLATETWVPGAGGSGSVFVYDSTATPAGNLYASWPDLIDAVGLVDGPKVIRFVRDCTIPAGAWDLNEAEFWAMSIPHGTATASVVVTVPTGVTFQNPGDHFLSRGLCLYSTSTAPVIDFSDGGDHFVGISYNAHASSKTAPLWDVSGAGGTIVFAMSFGGGLVKPSDVGIGGGDSAVLTISGTPDVVVVSDTAGAPNLRDNVISTTTASVIRLRQTLSVQLGIAASVGDTQTGITGGGTYDIYRSGDASLVNADSSGMTHSTAGTVQAILADLDAAISAGGVVGPVSSTAHHFAKFADTSGALLEDGGAAPSGAVVGTTDSQTLTNKTLTSPAISSPTGLVKGDVGLGNVDNTSNATERAATATLTNKTLTAPVINSPTGLVKADVGLGSVTNALQLVAASNLSDLANAGTARTNLGLGSLATASSLTGPLVYTAYNGTAVASTTTPTSLLTGAGTTGSVTLTATAGQGLRITAGGQYTNNSGGATTPTLSVKLGSTTILTFAFASLAASATVRAWFLDATVFVNASSDYRATGNAGLRNGLIYDRSGAKTDAIQSGLALDLVWTNATSSASETAALDEVMVTRIVPTIT